jgi:hypothetical protein
VHQLQAGVGQCDAAVAQTVAKHPVHLQRQHTTDQHRLISSMPTTARLTSCQQCVRSALAFRLTAMQLQCCCCRSHLQHQHFVVPAHLPCACVDEAGWRAHAVVAVGLSRDPPAASSTYTQPLSQLGFDTCQEISAGITSNTKSASHNTGVVANTCWRRWCDRERSAANAQYSCCCHIPCSPSSNVRSC